MTSLRHVLWIGGPPRTGKSTIARRIARRHGLRWYNADAHTWEHRDRALRAGNAAAHRWEALTPDERSSAPAAERFAMSLHAERGPMIVDDLLLLPSSPMIVAEGTPISASVVRADRQRGVWLIPTGERRDRSLLAEAIEQEATGNAVRVLAVDGSRGVDDTVTAVEELFAEPLSEGPRAQTQAERRGLPLYANEAVVAQCLAYLARPWSRGDPESLIREFGCECGDPDCDAVVEAPIAAASRPLLAPGHR